MAGALTIGIARLIPAASRDIPAASHDIRHLTVCYLIYNLFERYKSNASGICVL